MFFANVHLGLQKKGELIRIRLASATANTTSRSKSHFPFPFSPLLHLWLHLPWLEHANSPAHHSLIPSQVCHPRVSLLLWIPHGLVPGISLPYNYLIDEVLFIVKMCLL